MVEQFDILKKINLHSYLVSYTPFDSKWIIDLSVKVETFYKETEEKFLEGNRGALCDL